MWESDKALQAVRQCAKEGFGPVYAALGRVTTALKRNGEVEMVKELVDEVGMKRGNQLPENVQKVLTTRVLRESAPYHTRS